MRSFVIGLKTFSRHQPETFLIIYFFIFMMNLYLGNLNYKVKEGDLEELLSAYGAVTSKTSRYCQMSFFIYQAK